MGSSSFGGGFGGSSSFGSSSGGSFGGSSSNSGNNFGGGGSSCSKTDFDGTTTTREIKVEPNGDGSCSQYVTTCTKPRRGEKTCTGSQATGFDCSVPRCTI